MDENLVLRCDVCTDISTAIKMQPRKPGHFIVGFYYLKIYHSKTLWVNKRERRRSDATNAGKSFNRITHLKRFSRSASGGKH